MTLGLGLPNAQFRKYFQRELKAVRDLGPDNLLIIAYHDDDKEYDRITQEAELCRDLGITAPLVRVYRPTVRGLNPVVCAAEDARLFQLYLGAGLTPGWIPWNEMNIEGWGEDWSAQIEYAKAYLSAFTEIVAADNLELGVEVHLPALSPIGDYEDSWYAYRDAGLGDRFDFADVHCYEMDDLQDADTLGAIVGLPVVCTEVNQMLPSIYAPALARNGCDESYWFILSSDDPAFYQYSLLRNPDLYEDFKATAQQKEEPMPEFVLGFKVLAERLRADGHTVLAFSDEISIDHASLQRVMIDSEPNLFAWQDGQESVVVYPYPLA